MDITIPHTAAGKGSRAIQRSCIERMRDIHPRPLHHAISIPKGAVSHKPLWPAHTVLLSPQRTASAASPAQWRTARAVRV